MLEYQDKFPIYQYTYVKGKDTYYLESIERGYNKELLGN